MNGITAAVRAPAVGDIVHFVPNPAWEAREDCWAALVTGTAEIRDGRHYVYLTVFQPRKLPGHLNVPVPPDPLARHHTTWHWPEAPR